MTTPLPSELAELKLGGKVLTCHAYQAVVLSERTESTTHVTSQRNLRGQVSDIGSYTTKARNCWVRYPNGVEGELQLPDLPVRAGHVLTIISVSGGGLTTGNQIRPLAFVNHATKQWNKHDLLPTMKQLSGLDSPLAQGLANLLVLATLGLGILLLAFISSQKKQRYLAPLDQRLRKIATWSLSQPLSVAASNSSADAASA